MHGANATGRPFTGDYAGIILYETLYKFNYSNRPESITKRLTPDMFENVFEQIDVLLER